MASSLHPRSGDGISGSKTSMSAVVRSIGTFEIVPLLDASGPFFLSSRTAFPDATPRDLEHARSLDPDAFGRGETWTLDFRCFAIRGPGDRIVLVDTGVGPDGSPAATWAPVPGRLPDRLTAAGIDPAVVDVVVLTHLHEDHFGWSVDPTGKPMFPNARYLVQEREIAALDDDATAVSYIVNPLRGTGQLQLVDGPTCLTTGPRSGESIQVVATPGHTPGHQSVMIDSPPKQMIVTGDVLVHAVQIVAPDVGYRYEADPDVARRTRRALLAEAKERRSVLATAHLTQPFLDLPR